MLISLRSFLTASLLLSLCTAWSQSVSGVWQGAIEVPGSPLEIVVTFSDDGTGAITIPVQGVQEVPLTEVALSNDAVSFGIRGVPGEPTFTGTLAGGQIEGTFSQGGQAFPFTLTLRDAGGAAQKAVEPAQEGTFEDPEGRYSVPVPTNWSVQEGEDFVTLTSPEGDTNIYVLTLPNATLTAAVDEGWARVSPDFNLEPDDTQEPPSEPGVERTLVVTYEEGERIAQAFARRYQGAAYLLLIDTTLAAAQRRGAQLNIVASGFQISDLGEVDLTDAQPLQVDATMIGELEAYIADALERFGIPGAAIAVVQGGEVVYEGGFGVKEKGDPKDLITADTHMMIGSTGKTMTTMLMATLVDEGRVTWDTPAREVLPEFSVADPELSESITLRDLVCACTGVPRRDLEWLFNADDLSAEGVVESLGAFEFFTAFGEAFQYSNQMVATGGYAAAAADGAEWGALFDGYADSLRRRVLEPVGMDDTTLSFDEVRARGDYASPHSIGFSGENEPFSLGVEEILRPVGAAGAHWSTASDMARYLIAELNLGVTQDGTRVVSEENLRAAWEPQVEVSADESYGLGWFVGEYKGVDLLNHGGNTFGFTSDFAFLPGKGLGIVVLTNAQGTNAFNAAVRERLFELVFEQVSQADARATFAFEQLYSEIEEGMSNLVDLDVATLEPYLGTYENGVLGEVKLRAEGERVVFDSGEFRAVMRALEEEGETRYLFDGPPVSGTELEFTEDDSGNPTLTLGGGAAEYVFIKR